MSLEISTEVTTDAFTVIRYVRNCLASGLVPFLKGKPGVGKSAGIHALAKEYNLKLIDLRLAQLDPTDLNGFPAPDPVTGRARFLVPEVFPMENDPLPKDANGKEMNGWLLFLDELSNASNLVQGAAFKLVLDRKIGQHNLNEKCFIVCAGNRETDRAAAGKVNSAMRSRLAHFTIESNVKLWTNWAMNNKIDHRIISFINFKPELINNFDPSHSNVTYACERTWEALHKYISALKDNKIIPEECRVPFSGIIGEGPANEFIGFVDIYQDLPNLDDIRRDPKGAPIPHRMDVQFALTGALAQKLDTSNIDDYMHYIKRMGIEHQILVIRQASIRDKALQTHSAIAKWSMENAAQLGMLK